MRRLKLLFILSIIFGISVVAPSELLFQWQLAPEGRLEKDMLRLAQSAVGYHCKTQAGICPIDPAPLGAPCRCGTYQGFVVP